MICATFAPARKWRKTGAVYVVGLEVSKVMKLDLFIVDLFIVVQLIKGVKGKGKKF